MNKIEANLPNVYFHFTRQGISFRGPGDIVEQKAQPIHHVPDTAELASLISKPMSQYPEPADIETVIEASQSTVRGNLPGK